MFIVKSKLPKVNSCCCLLKEFVKFWKYFLSGSARNDTILEESCIFCSKNMITVKHENVFSGGNKL